MRNSNEQNESMDRTQMVAFLEDLMDTYHHYLGLPEFFDEPAGVLGRWVRTARPEWLPLAISLVGDYSYVYGSRSREDWYHYLVIMLDEWAQIEPQLVLPEMARLMEDPERRETALHVFACANWTPLSKYLVPWVPRTAELSDDHLE